MFHLPSSIFRPPSPISRLLSSVLRLPSALKILLAYFVLTLICTYPLALNLTTAIPGDGYDGWQNYWNLWWARRALLELNTSPFFTSDLFYPTGASLYFHTLNLFNGLWTLPLHAWSNLAFIYNSVVIFSFVVSAYGAYLLATYTLNQCLRAAHPTSFFDLASSPLGDMDKRFTLHAFLAGFIFAFSPFRFAHLLGHMQVFSTEWLPFFGLTFLQMHTRRDALWRRAFLPALFLALTALCDWYFVLYLLLFGVIVVVYQIMCCAKFAVQASESNVQPLMSPSHSPMLKRRFAVSNIQYPLSNFFAVVGWFSLLISPILVPMLREGGAAAHLRPPLEESIALSADLLAFVTPSEFHPVWGEAMREFGERFTTSAAERTVFAGFAPLLLASIAIWRWRQQRALRLWSLALLIFFVFALGPYLHIGGQIISTFPLPYLWLYTLAPLVNITRSISRYDVMVMLALAVLAALGLRAWRARRVIVWLVCGLIFFEFLAAPYPLTPVAIAPFYLQLRDEVGTFALLELPINIDRPDPLVYQTVHAHPLVSAYTSRLNPLSLVERTPILNELRSLAPDVIHYDTRTIGASVLDDLRVRYVINHPLTMGEGDERTVTNRVLRELFGNQRPIVNEPNLVVYRVMPPTPHQPYLVLGDGWGAAQPVNGNTQRTIAASATVQVMARTTTTATLQITARAASQPTLLRLARDRKTLGEFVITTENMPISVPLNLQAQSFTLELIAAHPLSIKTLSLQTP